MSTESKFSFSLSPYAVRRYQRMLPVIATGLMLICLPDVVYSYSDAWTIVLAYSVLAVFSLAVCWRAPSFSVPPQHWRVSQTGHISVSRNRETSEDAPWLALTSSSRVLSGMLYVHLAACEASPSQQNQSYWLFRGEVSERCFRRLSRLISDSSHSKRNVLLL